MGDFKTNTGTVLTSPLGRTGLKQEAKKTCIGEPVQKNVRKILLFLFYLHYTFI